MNNFLCFLFGHKYRLDIKFDHSVRRVKCKRCRKLFGMNDHVKALVDWDGEMEEAHRLIYPEKFKK